MSETNEQTREPSMEENPHVAEKYDHMHDDAQQHGVGHVVPYRYLIFVGLALLFFTWLTVAVMNIDLGEGNIYLALAIATLKAGLVVLFFMHLFWDRAINAIIFITSIAGVALFISFSLTDTMEYSDQQREYQRVELQGGDAKAVQDMLMQTSGQLQGMMLQDNEASEGEQTESADH